MWSARRHPRVPGMLAAAPVSLATSLRAFYTGLDESRIRRLRRSGMTFNKPRGRDTLSLAFESRIRVRPLVNLSDLYAAVHPPSHDLRLRRAASLPARRPESPSDAAGVEDKSDARSRSGGGDGEAGEGAGVGASGGQVDRLEWRVLVVDPVAAWQVEMPIAYPCAHPGLYTDWATQRCTGEGGVTCHIDSGSPTAGESAAAPPLAGRLDWRPLNAAVYGRGEDELCSQPQPHLPVANRRHLRQNGDTTLLAHSFTQRFPGAVPRTAGEAQAADPAVAQHARFFLSMVVDPFIDLERFRREEAQVEMISGYRNIFYEAAELPAAGPAHAAATVADVVRVPALSVYSCGPRFLHEIAKLNQQSLIKGFHRISNEAKERLIMNANFTVELYVPPLLLNNFEQAFAEDAWDTPLSTLNPGRTALYPGLAPPRTLLDYDGWVGKRPELVEAVESEGRSLMRGRQYALDGSEVRPQEVLTHIRVFGAREEEAARLAAERQTTLEKGAEETSCGEGEQGWLGTPSTTAATAPQGGPPPRSGLEQEYEGAGAACEASASRP